MSDLEQILSGEQPDPVAEVAPEPVVEEAEAEAPQAEAEVEAAPEESPTPAPEAPSAEPTAPEPQMVPVGAIQGLRKELRALKDQLPQREAPPAPDFYENPQEAIQHQMAPVQQQVIAQKLETSRFMAEQQFGKETVDAAFEYFNQHPQESQALLQHASPFHAAVDAYNKGRVAQEIGADPDAYKAKIEAEVRAKIESEMVAKQAKDAAAVVAPSLAGITGTGRGSAQAFTGQTSLDDILG